MRLPRKRKKEVKKIVAVKTAYKMVMTAMVTAQSASRHYNQQCVSLLCANICME